MYKELKNWGGCIKVILKLSCFLNLNEIFSLIIAWLCSPIYSIKTPIEHFENKKIGYIRKWLDERYGDFVPSSFNIEWVNKSVKNEIIWILWYQGEESMPEITRLCYNSICNNANNRKVVLLTKDNLSNYISLPSNIYEKVDQGKISFTHLSDIVRMNLLYSYGGLWMDCTILTIKKIDTNSYNNLFYSIKNYPLTKGTISGYRWSGFYLYATKGSPAFKIFLNLFYEYWKDNNELIEYFLIDYFFDMLYRKNHFFRKTIDSIPYTNPHLHTLIKDLNKPFEESVFKKQTDETSIFKFNYRLKFVKKQNQHQTLYGYLTQNMQKK